MEHMEAGAQRKIEFENALLELMKEMPYSRITVKDLAQRLHLVRKTFYHYFTGKDACLESLTDRMLFEYSMHLLNSLPEEASRYQLYEQQLLFWMSRQDFLNAIIGNGMIGFLLDRFMVYIQRENPDIQNQLSTPSLRCDEDILFYYVSNEMLMLLKWCSEGFKLPLHEMVIKRLRLVHEPLFPPELLK